MRTVTLEAVAGVVIALTPGGAMTEVGALSDFFQAHDDGGLRIANIERPDLAAVYGEWKRRKGEGKVAA